MERAPCRPDERGRHDLGAAAFSPSSPDHGEGISATDQHLQDRRRLRRAQDKSDAIAILEEVLSQLKGG